MKKCMMDVKTPLFAALLVACALSAFATPIAWKGASGGSWSEPTNWEGGVVPNGSGVEVDFSAASGTYSVNVDVAVTVGKITVNGATATTLTLSGSKITFAGSSTPEVSVGSGHTLLTTTAYGGNQGVRKTGAGTWKPTAQSSGNSFSGDLVVEAGVLQPVKAGDNVHFCNAIEVRSGATFILSTADIFGSSVGLKALGGTMGLQQIDYMGGMTFSDGGLITSPLQLIDNNGATASITANGDGVAGTFKGPLVGESRYGQYKNNRTIQVNVVNAGAEFLMTGYILENRLQATTIYGNDIYHGETEEPKYPVVSLTKSGNGDLVLYDETISLRGPTTVNAGRLVLSNSVKMAASAITLKTGVSQLVLREGASLQIGGLNCAATDTLDLGGQTLSIGGTADDAVFCGTFANGTIRKVGNNTQQVGAGLSQSDLDVLGGTLAIGVPMPKVRYTFDDADSIGADAGVLGKTLSLSAAGAATYAEGGIRGGCASFNGTGCLQADAATGLPCGNSAFTISLWMKTTTSQGNRGFTAWGEAAGSKFNGLLLDAGTKLKHVFWEGNSDFTSVDRSHSLLDGTWHHIALTYEPATGTRVFYIDGAAFDSKVVVATRAIPDTEPFKIGAASQYNGNYNGYMDEVMVFDRALTAAEIMSVKAWGDGTPLSPSPAFAAGGTVRLERDATLSIGSASQTFSNLSGKGTLALNNGATATVASDSSASIGRLAGDGTLVKTGSGTLSLTAASNLGGTLDVRGGSVSATGPCVDDDLKSHLIACWDFNDRNNPGKDASGNGVDLAPYTASGTGNNSGEAYNWRNAFETVGGAAYFDGKANTHYLVMADSANEARLPNGANPTFTISMWVNPDPDVNNVAGFFYWGASTAGASVCVAMRFNDGTKLNPFFWGGGDYTWTLPADFKTGVVPDGWHHVVFAAGGDSHVRALYVDGQYVAGGTDTRTLAIPASNFCLGYEISQKRAFKGYMDDVMIFDKVLTVDEVRKLMNNGLGSAPTGGSKVLLASDTSFSVASGTVGLSEVSGSGTVSVAADANLVLAGGASDFAGGLGGSGLLTVTNGASLHLGGGQTFGGTLSVEAGGVLDLRSGASATVQTLNLAEGAGFAVAASDSTATPCLTASTAVALPSAANVRVAVPDGLGAKVELLHSDVGLSGSIDGWTVEWNLPKRNWTSSLTVKGNSVWAEARPLGFILTIF